MKKTGKTTGLLSPSPRRKKNAFIAASAAIIIITFIAYIPAIHNELTNWDDNTYIVNNSRLGDFSPEATGKVFSSFFQGNYHPVTLLSLGIDYKIGRNNPVVYHSSNIFLHIVNSLLVLWFLYALTGDLRIAFVSALLFGVHTVHVESVAWVSERKDLLYTAFFLASVICYVKYVVHNRITLYVFSFILFCLSALSKGQAVSLPLTIIAIDALMRKNLRPGKSIAEKAPFFLAGLAFGIVAVVAQHSEGAVKEVPLIDRIPVACYGFSHYILKLFLPAHLSAFYPYPSVSAAVIPPTFWLYLLPVMAIAGLFYFWLKKGDAVAAFGVAFFTINIFFVLQLFPVGRAIMADRYTYLPSAGFFDCRSKLSLFQFQFHRKKNMGGLYRRLCGHADSADLTTYNYLA
jgi:protein O-mannosyl-transferase